MAQDATTATHVSPTPPTNTANAFGGSPPTTAGLSPVDDGAPANPLVFKAAGAGATHEGAGSEVTVTAPGSRTECPTVSFSCLGNYTSTPNEDHASYTEGMPFASNDPRGDA